MKRLFDIDMFRNGDKIGTVTIEIDQSVIDNVDDAWRDSMYNLISPEDIMEHVAYNLIINKTSLSNIDGWANLPDDFARVIKDLNIYDEWQCEAREITKSK